MSKSHSKVLLITIVIGALVLAILNTITSREALPDRAKFAIVNKDRIIVPVPTPGQFVFHPVYDSKDAVFLKSDGTVTWGELKNPKHPCHNFTLPDTPEWNEFSILGPETSLLRLWLYGEESRWTDDGYWRY